MMANPELVRRMMMSNPQTREVMENNPEVAQMLNDPSFLRQVQNRGWMEGGQTGS